MVLCFFFRLISVTLVFLFSLLIIIGSYISPNQPLKKEQQPLTSKNVCFLMTVFICICVLCIISVVM